MPEKTIRWSVHVVHPSLESYAKGRVALLGDAVRDRTMLTALFPLMNQKNTTGARDATPPGGRRRTRHRGRVSSDTAAQPPRHAYCERPCESDG